MMVAEKTEIAGRVLMRPALIADIFAFYSTHHANTNDFLYIHRFFRRFK